VLKKRQACDAATFLALIRAPGELLPFTSPVHLLFTFVKVCSAPLSLPVA